MAFIPPISFNVRTNRVDVMCPQKNAAELEKRLPKPNDARWSAKARFIVDGNVAWERSLRKARR